MVFLTCNKVNACNIEINQVGFHSKKIELNKSNSNAPVCELNLLIESLDDHDEDKTTTQVAKQFKFNCFRIRPFKSAQQACAIFALTNFTSLYKGVPIYISIGYQRV